MALARELTQKQQKDSSDSESEQEVPTNQPTDNPWLSSKNQDNDDEIFSGYRKFWEERNKNEKEMKTLRKSEEVPKEKIRSDEDMSEESSSEPESETVNESRNSDWLEEDIESDQDPNSFLNDLFDKAEDNINKKVETKLEKLKPNLLTGVSDNKKKQKKKNKSNVHDPKYLEFAKKAQIGDIDEALMEANSDQEDKREYIPPSKRLIHEIESIKEEKKAFMRGTKDEINPEEFLKIKSKHLLTALPKTLELDDADENEVEDLTAANKMSLAEAFENDDIIQDFVEDAENEAKQSQLPESIGLPGWGSWGGEGVKEKKKFDKKKLDVKKKDRVIVNTTPPESLRKHLISTVPFPFKNIKDFEASLRFPIGKDFIPSAAYSKLTMENIVTKAGTIIEPMTEDALVKEQDKKRGGKRKFIKHRGNNRNKKSFVKN